MGVGRVGGSSVGVEKVGEGRVGVGRMRGRVGVDRKKLHLFGNTIRCSTWI